MVQLRLISLLNSILIIIIHPHVSIIFSSFVFHLSFTQMYAKETKYPKGKPTTFRKFRLKDKTGVIDVAAWAKNADNIAFTTGDYITMQQKWLLSARKK